MWKSILKFVLGILMSKADIYTIGQIISGVGNKKYGDKWDTGPESDLVKGLQSDNK